MNLPIRIAYNNACATITIAICGALSAIAAALNYLRDILDFLLAEKFPPFLPIVLALSLLFITVYTLVVGFVALMIHIENRRLKDAFKYFREINLIYRDSLFDAFYGNDPMNIKDRKALMGIETKTLSSVCQRISNIFGRLTGRDCMIAVKLLTKKEDGTLYATTCSRSEDHSERDKPSPKESQVNTGRNTAFDCALDPKTTGRIPYFYSADLLKLRAHGGYNNERSRWERYYKSAIVVPIQCSGVPGKLERNDIGLLCVDTKSRNRLNDSYHVEIMAAFADQMYNFISLMRGNYTVSTKEREEE